MNIKPEATLHMTLLQNNYLQNKTCLEFCEMAFVWHNSRTILSYRTYFDGADIYEFSSPRLHFTLFCYVQAMRTEEVYFMSLFLVNTWSSDAYFKWNSKVRICDILSGYILWRTDPTGRDHAKWWLQFIHHDDTYWAADKSLARPGRKQARKHVRDARDFNNIETRAVIKFFLFFPARQGAEGISRHSDRNISLFPSWSG